MIPPSFDYAVPKTLNDAMAILGQNPDAKILAGGHSLLPMMKFRLATPALLVDINRLEGLAYIREEAGWLKIGAMTREADLDRSALIKQNYPLLADTARMRRTMVFGDLPPHRRMGPDRPVWIDPAVR